jgi:RNA polymerase sigma-70 factor (ECF subfamily)
MKRSQAAFRRVFEQHHRDVHAYCLRRTNPDDALDAAAEVFLTAWRRMEDMPDGESALPWLYGVARRVLSRQWRSQSRLRRLVSRSAAVGIPPTDDPENVVVRREELAVVLEALGRLSAGDQEVLRLSAWDELPHATIADLLGCSINAVDQRIHRAKGRLARQYWSLAGRSRSSRAVAHTTQEGGAA